MKKKLEIRSRYFSWKLFFRKGTWYADGRSGNGGANLKRYSLNSNNYDQALEYLGHLDALRAVELGKASRHILADSGTTTLSLEDGRKLYMDHVQGPAVVGGASPSTAKRYRAVFDKFIPFAIENGVHSWNQVDAAMLKNYAAWLDANDYEYATEYLELTTLKQAVKRLVKLGHLPKGSEIDLRLREPGDTTTYCYTLAEISALIAHCHANPELRWLGDVIVCLSHTGMRVGELAASRWSDIDGDVTTWTVPDQSRRGTLNERQTGRTTKGKRSRSIAINDLVHNVLVRLRDDRHSDGRIFHGPNGGVLKPDTLRVILMRDVLAPLSAQFPAKLGTGGLIDGRLHSFRHFFCSWCANSHVPETMLMAWMGHASSKMVRRYYHLQGEEARTQMQKLKLNTV